MKVTLKRTVRDEKFKEKNVVFKRVVDLPIAPFPELHIGLEGVFYVQKVYVELRDDPGGEIVCILEPLIAGNYDEALAWHETTGWTRLG